MKKYTIACLALATFFFSISTPVSAGQSCKLVKDVGGCKYYICTNSKGGSWESKTCRGTVE